MRISANEILGLNSLLDGKKIWGFNEWINSDISYEEKVNIATKLSEYGEQGMQELLTVLNAYKQSNNYVVVNGYNIAVLEDGLLGLSKLENDYQFFVVDRKWLTDYIKTEEKVLFFQYKNGEIRRFDYLSKKAKKNYLFNMLNQENIAIESNDMENLLERYLC